MSKPVNLNKVRKDRARSARRAQADANTITFGRTKTEKELEKARAEKAARRIDDHKLDS